MVDRQIQTEAAMAAYRNLINDPTTPPELVQKLAIISPDDWHAVQRILEQHKQNRKDKRASARQART